MYVWSGSYCALAFAICSSLTPLRAAAHPSRDASGQHPSTTATPPSALVFLSAQGTPNGGE
jgi:hypothetical protein